MGVIYGCRVGLSVPTFNSAGSRFGWWRIKTLTSENHCAGTLTSEKNAYYQMSMINQTWRILGHMQSTFGFVVCNGKWHY